MFRELSPEDRKKLRKEMERNKEKERMKNDEELSPENIEQQAEGMLADMDLSWEDLKGKKVIDLGANYGMIERAARDKGVEGIVSLDYSAIGLSKKPEVKGRTQGNISNLPFRDNSFDLAIARASLNIKHKDVALKAMREIERVISKNGEARIYPARFHFEVPGTEGEVERLFGENLESRKRNDFDTARQLDDRRGELELQKTGYHTEFLKDHGFEIELEKNQKQAREMFRYYWVLKKTKKG